MKVYEADCLEWLEQSEVSVDLSFLDPPFNQGHRYRHFNDRQKPAMYWKWMEDVLAAVKSRTSEGGSVYFMHREKNAEQVVAALRKCGWTFQSFIIWKKMVSPVPQKLRFGKQYQIIVFATNGKKPRVFNRLRIDLPLAAHQKIPRKDGVFVTDIWEDIRELTSGFYAGDEPLRTEDGKRFHYEQSPVALLARIILSSSMPGDLVFDPFAGSGTSLVVAKQLRRQGIGLDIDGVNVKKIRERVAHLRNADNISKLRNYYRFTPEIKKIWPVTPLPK